MCVHVCVSLRTRSFLRRHLERVSAHLSSPADGGAERQEGGGGGQPGLLPSAGALLRCVPVCSAPLCQATDIHSLGSETEEEGETEGGLSEEARSAAHSGTDKLWALCLSLLAAEPLLPHSSATESQQR